MSWMCRAQLSAAILIGACASDDNTGTFALGDTHVATLRLGATDRFDGDGISIETDEQFAFGSADLRVGRDFTWITGYLRTDYYAFAQPVGQVGSLDDIPMPPAAFDAPPRPTLAL